MLVGGLQCHQPHRRQPREKTTSVHSRSGTIRAADGYSKQKARLVPGDYHEVYALGTNRTIAARFTQQSGSEWASEVHPCPNGSGGSDQGAQPLCQGGNTRRFRNTDGNIEGGNKLQPGAWNQAWHWTSQREAEDCNVDVAAACQQTGRGEIPAGSILRPRGCNNSFPFDFVPQHWQRRQLNTVD